MIQVTRFGGKPIYLNSDLVETIESAPDTTLLLTTGRRVIVRESAEEVVRRVVAFRRQIMAPPALITHAAGPANPTDIAETAES
ncbi:MAG: flagellar FlbD family protein [Chloroflexota bacterium]